MEEKILNWKAGKFSSFHWRPHSRRCGWPDGELLVWESRNPSADLDKVPSREQSLALYPGI